ncbi:MULTISPECIES: DUF6194 family protein [Microbacterium]|uniref:DUF6194 domain-containing protein n=1 Tax=Microbacterium sufflavum TaxID=2851649 RepID=A0ABY4ID11_9MICO|nr:MULTISPECIES: DUF6194 family protein [Microbacterium]UPL10447.1 hypothetical protein KV394_04710 [Microbacterium sufflavum]
MDRQQIIEAVRSFDGALAMTPQPGSEFPELSWGDAYFFFAPDGRMPERTQPFGTIITKDYPDDASSDLTATGRFRVNIHVGRERAAALVPSDPEPTASDVFRRHPLYGDAGWVCVIEPGERTADTVLDLLREAHDTARRRAERRGR